MIFPFENVTCTWTAPQRVWMAVPVYVAVALETVVADVPHQRLRASSPGIPRAASTAANPSRSSTVT